MSIFKKKKDKIVITSLKTIKTLARPTKEECDKFNPLSKPLPTHIRKVDKQLVLDVMDRIHGPQGIDYEAALRDLNLKYEARKGKSGSDFYDDSVFKGNIQSTTYYKNSVSDQI